VIQGGGFVRFRRHRPGAWLKPYRRTRSKLYRAARVMGNVQPWLELSPSRILERWLNRLIGRAFSNFAYGKGPLARIIRRLF
jgi:hypothetical protein